MEITIRTTGSDKDGEPGESAEIAIQQVGGEKSDSESTDVIIETSESGGTIRVTDGKGSVNIRLADDFTIEGMLEEDVWIPDPVE